MLLHLVFPNHFEDIAWPYDKERTADRFSDLVSGPNADVDRKLVDIREALSGKCQ
jgi:hypothetical protein